MKEPDWQRIQEIYHEALNLPRSERSNFVVETCKNDPVLAREVSELLDAEDSTLGFLQPPILELPLTSSDDLLETTVNERYFIEKELGGGGMSQVYLARDLRLNRRAVVIKILSRELLENSYALRKFRQETEALSRIHHDNVVEVLDTGVLADGRPYFVMQYIGGETLRSQIPAEGMNLERAASILKQVGAALAHVHEKYVFHRDLKPENIMLRCGTDAVVLVDFGIAKVQDSVVATTTANGASAGTLLYMSPEQLRGEEITAASDIYSMGVNAYEMVTGRRPFNPTSPPHLLTLQSKGVRVKPCDLRENLPASAQTIILRALSFEPKDRYGNAGEFGADLAGALIDSRTALGKKPRFKVIGIPLLILLGVSLISFGIYSYFKRGGNHEPNRSFSYFLTVQRMRDGQPYKDPVQSNGDEIYEDDARFQLTVSTPVPAYLYIFNEGPPEPNDTSFRMLYPNRATNRGSASLGANQSVQSDWITFRGPAGAENFWIVWSTAPVGELDAVTGEAAKHPLGGLTGQTLVTVKQYLTARESEIDATTYNYNANKTAVVRGRRDLLVTLAQFKHR